MNCFRKNEAGQILLITLLVLSVAMTVALGLIGRTTTDVAITNQLEESVRAFNAAEAGIEASLQTGPGINGSVVAMSAGDAKYSVSVTSLGSSSLPFKLPSKTVKGNTATIWLVNHFSDGSIDYTPFYTTNTIDICWSSETTTPAVVLGVLYKKSSGSYHVARGAYDTNAASRGNQFATSGIVGPAQQCGQTANYYKKTINFSSDFGLTLTGGSRDTLVALRIRPVYADSWVVVDPSPYSATLPTQANQYDVTGSTGTGVTRRIVATQYFSAASSLFDHAVYSQTTYTQ